MKSETLPLEEFIEILNASNSLSTASRYFNINYQKKHIPCNIRGLMKYLELIYTYNQFDDERESGLWDVCCGNLRNYKRILEQIWDCTLADGSRIVGLLSLAKAIDHKLWLTVRQHVEKVLFEEMDKEPKTLPISELTPFGLSAILFYCEAVIGESATIVTMREKTAGNDKLIDWFSAEYYLPRGKELVFNKIFNWSREKSFSLPSESGAWTEWLFSKIIILT